MNFDFDVVVCVVVEVDWCEVELVEGLCVCDCFGEGGVV